MCLFTHPPKHWFTYWCRHLFIYLVCLYIHLSIMDSFIDSFIHLSTTSSFIHSTLYPPLLSSFPPQFNSSLIVYSCAGPALNLSCISSCPPSTHPSILWSVHPIVSLSVCLSPQLPVNTYPVPSVQGWIMAGKGHSVLCQGKDEPQRPRDGTWGETRNFNQKGFFNPGLERGLCFLGIVAPVVNFKLQTYVFYYMKW